MQSKTNYEQGHLDAMAGAPIASPHSPEYIAGYEDACEALETSKFN